MGFYFFLQFYLVKHLKRFLAFNAHIIAFHTGPLRLLHTGYKETFPKCGPKCIVYAYIIIDTKKKINFATNYVLFISYTYDMLHIKP